MKSQDSLTRLLVAVILGYDRHTELVSAAFNGRDGFHVVSMRRLLADAERRNVKRPDALGLFCEQAAAAFNGRRHTLVITGFPTNEIDAHHVRRMCPKLSVFSLEETNVESIVYKSIVYNFDGLTQDHFRAIREREMATQLTVKDILAGHAAHVVHGSRAVAKQQRFVANRLESVTRDREVQLEAKIQNVGAPARELVPA